MELTEEEVIQILKLIEESSFDELDWILKQGVTSIVTMTENALPEKWVSDIGYLHVPTPDLTAPDMDKIDTTVDFIHKGVSGIINAMPFTCMPGTVSSALMKLIQKEYDVPVINIAYDGQGITNITTRLEAFMYQVKEHFKSRG